MKNLLKLKQLGFSLHLNEDDEFQLLNDDLVHLIKDPSEKVQLAAVKEDGHYIQYIKNPSEEIKLAAVKQNPDTIQCVKDPSEEAQLESIKKYPHNMRHIKNPTENVILYYITHYKNYKLVNITNLSDELIQKIMDILNIKDVLE